MKNNIFATLTLLLPAIALGACDAGDPEMTVDVIRSSQIQAVYSSVLETNPNVRVIVTPGDTLQGCYQLPDDLRVSLDGRDPQSMVIRTVSSDPAPFAVDCPAEELVVTFGYARPANPRVVTFRQANDQFSVQLPAREPADGTP